MNVISTYKYARISPFKAREVTREIQGLPVSAALDLLAFTPRRAALLISKTLKSAIANAENNNNLRADALVVREAVVGEGPTLKRFQPKARGSAGPIRKRTSHIRIVVTDEIEIKTREPKKPASRKKAATHSKSKKAAAPADEQPAAETKVDEIPEAAAPESTDADAGTKE
jgi:large subunit ribosomal protein L22